MFGYFMTPRTLLTVVCLCTFGLLVDGKSRENVKLLMKLLKEKVTMNRIQNYIFIEVERYKDVIARTSNLNSCQEKCRDVYTTISNHCYRDLRPYPEKDACRYSVLPPIFKDCREDCAYRFRNYMPDVKFVWWNLPVELKIRNWWK